MNRKNRCAGHNGAQTAGVSDDTLEYMNGFTRPGPYGVVSRPDQGDVESKEACPLHPAEHRAGSEVNKRPLTCQAARDPAEHETVARLRYNPEGTDPSHSLSQAPEAQAKPRQEEIARMAEQAATLLACPDVLGEFANLCQEMGAEGEQSNAKLLYLIVTSRLLSRPVNAVIKGPSSGGKNYLVRTVLNAFPGSAFYALSGMSEKALAYSQEPLSHRVLVIYEAAAVDGKFFEYLIRTLLSEGDVAYEIVDRSNGGQTMHIQKYGPTGFITTTTQASLHPENETRLLSVNVRDDPDQTLSDHGIAGRAGEQRPASSARDGTLDRVSGVALKGR